MNAKLIWGTDIHLDVLQEDQNIRDWVREVIRPLEGNIVVLTGDVSVAPTVTKHIKILREESGKQIVFVLGNHDYWDGSISQVRREASAFSLEKDGIVWLGSTDFIPFGNKSAIVGHDGWYDAMNGNLKKSRFMMRDWFVTQEFMKELADIVQISRGLASDATQHVKNSCEAAIAAGKTNLIVLTHFPPFAEVCFYRGRRTDDNALPWYSSKIMGTMLVEIAEKYPNVNFTVLCGHTHSSADLSVRPNLRIVVGDADYGAPKVQMIGVSDE